MGVQIFPRLAHVLLPHSMVEEPLHPLEGIDRNYRETSIRIWVGALMTNYTKEDSFVELSNNCQTQFGR